VFNSVIAVPAICLPLLSVINNLTFCGHFLPFATNKSADLASLLRVHCILVQSALQSLTSELSKNCFHFSLPENKPKPLTAGASNSLP
jgi:hypothetical protein